MRIPLNPFWVFVVVALVVLVAIVVISRKRNETEVLNAPNEPGVTTGPSLPATLAVVFGLAVILVPFGIAIAALWGPSVGVVAYFGLLGGGLIGLAVSRRSRG